MSRQTPGTANKGIKKCFATGLTETNTIDLEGIGAIRFEGNSIYKWVLFDNGVGNVASVAGNVAYYLAVTGVSAGQYSASTVTMDRTDTADLGAGVFQAIIADGSFGWIQIRGPATLTTALTAGADGDALTVVGAGADGTLDVSAAVTDHVCAFADDASAKKIICNFPF